MNPNTEPDTNLPIVPAPVPTNPTAQPTVEPVVLPDINFLTGKVVDPNKQRHFLAAFFLSYIFGVFGIDRFYLGKIWTGILKLLTFGGLGVWALIDLNIIIAGGMRDKQGNKLLQADRYKKFASRTILISSLLILTIFVLLSVEVVYLVTNFMGNGGINGLIQSALGGNQIPNLNLNISPEQLKSLNIGL